MGTRDALAFRQARRDEFPGTADIERVVEMNEGLAQYTATVLAAMSREDAIAQLEAAPADPSLMRTFGYPLGTAYGLLLDRWPQMERGGRRPVGPRRMLAEGADVEPSPRPTERASMYDGQVLWQAEQRREQLRLERIRELRERFVEGPVVLVPRGRNASHVTVGVVALPEAGTIYPSYRVAGEWGILEAGRWRRGPDQPTSGS